MTPRSIEQAVQLAAARHALAVARGDYDTIARITTAINAPVLVRVRQAMDAAHRELHDLGAQWADTGVL